MSRRQRKQFHEADSLHSLEGGGESISKLYQPKSPISVGTAFWGGSWPSTNICLRSKYPGPIKFLAPHFLGDNVISATWAERKAAVEPPAIQAGAATRAELAEDSDLVLRQPGLVRDVVAD